MKNAYALRRWLAREILHREIPRKPPAKASALHNRPFRSYPYRRWIASLPSAVSGNTPCDPCHTGPHPFGQKADDRTCIPLTRDEHRQYDRDPAAFCCKYFLDLPTLIQRLNAAWWAGWREA